MAISLKHLERKLFEESKETPKVETPEWIWVEGYKGTDKDMKCRDYQFELGKQFDMPEGSDIILCGSGFHFCTKLKDVFSYYPIRDGNRFFKVRALMQVKKKEEETPLTLHYIPWSDSKETSKSIEFVRELTNEEIFKAHNTGSDFTEEEMDLARQVGVAKVYDRRKMIPLENAGYAHLVSEAIIAMGKYDTALALAQQTDISMDTRILVLFNGAPKRPDLSIKHFNLPAFGKYGTLGVDTSKKK